MQVRHTNKKPVHGSGHAPSVTVVMGYQLHELLSLDPASPHNFVIC